MTDVIEHVDEANDALDALEPRREYATRCPDCGAEPESPHGQAEYGRCDGYPVETLASGGKVFRIDGRTRAIRAA